MIRQRDVMVLAEGTFRVVLTASRRVVLAIDVPDSMLGPLHLAFAVGLGAWPSDEGADGVFEAASTVAPAVAQPALDLTRDAASVGASLVAHVPVPEADRERIDAASRTILRARLGDIHAQQFLRGVARAANAGAPAAQRAGDVLLAGSRVVSRALEAPRGGTPLSGLAVLEPLAKLDQVAGHIQRGDFDSLQKEIETGSRLSVPAEIVARYVERYGAEPGADIAGGPARAPVRTPAPLAAPRLPAATTAGSP